VTDGVAVLGIRHHGPGSARSVVRALEKLEPDLVLVEGPPDAQRLVPFIARPEMRPPVALVVYPSDKPARGVFYPFASFSP
jgi:pheromone shutdown protein TraB